MSDPAPDSRLLDEAIDLMIRLQNDPDNPVALEMVRAWRARGPEHERVWALVSGAHGATGTVLERRRKAARRGPTRRKLVVAGAVAIGGGLAGWSVLPDLLARRQADHVTAKGEVRRVTLPDGSVATLGPASAIALDPAAAHRAVVLLEGMAYFEVAPDPRRPFSVRAGPLTATALGTAFDVADDAGVVAVSVRQGVVEARAPEPGLAAGQTLRAGDWLSVDPASHDVDRGRRDAEQIAAWRDDRIVAERVPVKALVERIARWIPGRVVLADPFIGAQRVSGLFDLADPVAALAAVVHPAGARVRRISSFLTVVSPL
ncbi:FecR domain-containing protein [Rhodoplanes sp. TEM]|uniref:FecR domain-containing protein n=1 Tax=Rhodoplanes tepidamans TaxID=200616 RepID=A0ABT5JF28_RHOTP|nr:MULTISPECIES: FecR domain-containing protein [Rhodoplanes]MDC7788320.1 FecR domain-containing protein [Rhodoplanes tepidamans]MDC7986939.1 FecR domain-containing protein [Rhodoplanes sp. TEM]MDQ0358801.1 transmembrane sensor [Rhodoplanes tepidamans]